MKQRQSYLAGRLSFKDGTCPTRKSALEMARQTYPTVIDREWFMDGWDSAFYDARG